MNNIYKNMNKMEKKKIVYETPSTKEVLLKTEHYFMQGTNVPNQGSGGEDFGMDEGTW